MALLAFGVVLAMTNQASAVRCGNDPGDAAAIAATRELVASQCDCASAITHGDYMECAREVVNAAEGSGLRKACASSVLRCARKSTCGRPNAVTCCRTTASGKTSCRIARDADHCKAPRGGDSCVGNFTSCCDACDSGGCVQLPTPTPTPTKPPATLPPQPLFCQSSTSLPRQGRVVFTTTSGTANCGGAGLSPAPAPPFTGQLLNAAGEIVGNLGSGCLYTGSLPPAVIPDGSTSILDVVGISGSRLTLAGSAGTGPTDCTLGAGPDKHCSNGKPGLDGNGRCDADSDCSGKKGACNFDPNCYFGPPVPIPASAACAVSNFLTEACGSSDLSSKQSKLATVLSSRLYLTFDKMGCPRCINGTCSAGKNVGKACTGVGSLQTTIDCPPEDKQFLGTLTVVISDLTTGGSTLTADDAGIFCPDQTAPGAFGIADAHQINQTGVPLNGSGTQQSQTLVATFCLPSTGNPAIDGLGHLPAAGTLSAVGVLDLTNVLPLPPLPIPRP